MKKITLAAIATYITLTLIATVYTVALTSCSSEETERTVAHEATHEWGTVLYPADDYRLPFEVVKMQPEGAKCWYGPDKKVCIGFGFVWHISRTDLEGRRILGDEIFRLTGSIDAGWCQYSGMTPCVDDLREVVDAVAVSTADLIEAEGVSQYSLTMAFQGWSHAPDELELYCDTPSGDCPPIVTEVVHGVFKRFGQVL